MKIKDGATYVPLQPEFDLIKGSGFGIQSTNSL